MKISQSTKSLLAAMLVSVPMLFTACQKNADKTAENEEVTLTKNSMEAEAQSEVLFDDVFNNVIGVNASVGIGGTGEFQSAAHSDQPGTAQATCFNVSMEYLDTQDTFPVKVTIDFGNGCTGRDGRVRKGKIITVYTGHLIWPGSVAETSFEGYYVNDIKVEGSHRIENKSSANVLSFETRVVQGKLTNAQGDYINWNRTRLITQVDGLGTPWVPGDDAFSVVGNGSGTVKKGDHTSEWTSTNLEPLIKRFNCRWIVKGKQAIQRNGGYQGVVDFGNGDCDNKAILVVNGVSAEITLK
jgi:hypothetical protein